jgi:hypothetical protein
MSRSRMVLLASLWLLGGGLLVHRLSAGPVTQAAARASLPYHAYAAGPYRVQGNTILDVQGEPYYFHGVARDGLEFSCQGDAYLNEANLALLGPRVAGVEGTFWYGNTVRPPLSEAFWFSKA